MAKYNRDESSEEWDEWDEDWDEDLNEEDDIKYTAEDIDRIHNIARNISMVRDTRGIYINRDDAGEEDEEIDSDLDFSYDSDCISYDESDDEYPNKWYAGVVSSKFVALPFTQSGEEDIQGENRIKGIVVHVGSDSFYPKTVDDLRGILDGETQNVVFQAKYGCCIDAPVFSEYLGAKLDTDTVDLSEECLASIPSGTAFVTIADNFEDFDSLNVTSLSMAFPMRNFTIPKSVKHLEITQDTNNGNPVDRCGESGESSDSDISESSSRVTVDCKGARIRLMNCNKLQTLIILKDNTFVFGDFIKYLKSLKLDRRISHHGNLHYYLKNFEQLEEYDGPINDNIRSVLKHVESVQKSKGSTSSHKSAIVRIPAIMKRR